MKTLLLLLTMTTSTQLASAQSNQRIHLTGHQDGAPTRLIRCDSTHVQWLLAKYTLLYAAALQGRTVLETESPKVLELDGMMLQYTINDEARYIESAEDTGLTPLINYVKSEASYMANVYQSHLDLKIENASTDSRKALIWSFAVPQGPGVQVTDQFFVNMIIGDKIVGLATSRFPGQDLEVLKNFLLGSVDQIRRISPSDMQKLCRH